MAKIVQLKSNDAYQLKITLDDITPPIWRRFIVPADMKLPDLHKVIQTVMGWYNSHMHQFRINDQMYGLPDEDGIMECIDYRKVPLNGVVTKEKQKFHYDYDFGDGWEHTIVVEKIVKKDNNVKYPVCIAGKRNVPPEDCGGVGGYEELIDVLRHPGGDEYEDMIAWLGDDYDPEEFTIDRVNDMLKKKDYGCIVMFE